MRIPDIHKVPSSFYPGVYFNLWPKTLALRQKLDKALIPFNAEMIRIQIEQERIRADDRGKAKTERTAASAILEIRKPKAELRGTEPVDTVDGADTDANTATTATPTLSDPPSSEALAKIIELDEEAIILRDSLFRPIYLQTFLASVEELEAVDRETGEVVQVTDAAAVLKYTEAEFIGEILDAIGTKCGLSQSDKANLLWPSYLESQVARAVEAIRNTPAPSA